MALTELSNTHKNVGRGEKEEEAVGRWRLLENLSYERLQTHTRCPRPVSSLKLVFKLPDTSAHEIGCISFSPCYTASRGATNLCEQVPWSGDLRDCCAKQRNETAVHFLKCRCRAKANQSLPVGGGEVVETNQCSNAPNQNQQVGFGTAIELCACPKFG